MDASVAASDIGAPSLASVSADGPVSAAAVAPLTSVPTIVVFVDNGADRAARCSHDRRSKAVVAQWIADLLRLPFARDPDAAPGSARGRYFVPAETLDSTAAARLGIRGPGDLFGGMCAHPFVATKLITHPLPRDASPAPPGWSNTLGEAIAGVVLPGFSAFSVEDATLAGTRLLGDGSVRVKAGRGVGGAGQSVAADAAQLAQALEAIDRVDIERDGLVLERNLREVATRSVGQVRIGPWQASYWGEQHLTRNRDGDEVYGGSTLHVVRGDWDALLARRLDDAVRRAVEQAIAYDGAALAAFPELLATRRNYDVAQGLDDRGRWHSGVLEQSWRIGGASAAEVVALQALRDDPGRQVVGASTHEVHGDDVRAPSGARVHFDGAAPDGGRLLKYAVLDGDGQL